MANFLKIGEFTINISAIAYIKWNCTRCEQSGSKAEKLIKTHRVYFSTDNSELSYLGYLSFDADSDDAAVLNKYFETSQLKPARSIHEIMNRID